MSEKLSSLKEKLDAVKLQKLRIDKKSNSSNMYEKLENVLDSAYELNIKLITLDFDKVELELPRSLIEEYDEVDGASKKRRSKAVISASDYSDELLEDEHILYIKQKQPEITVGSKTFYLLDAYKAPKDEESMKNIEQYYPDDDTEDLVFGDIVMEFQY